MLKRDLVVGSYQRAEPISNDGSHLFDTRKGGHLAATPGVILIATSLPPSAKNSEAIQTAVPWYCQGTQ